MSKSDFSLLEAAELVSDLASQEWQEPDGRRCGAVDNFGKRLWFIGDDLMQELRLAITDAKRTKPRRGTGSQGG